MIVVVALHCGPVADPATLNGASRKECFQRGHRQLWKEEDMSNGVSEQKISLGCPEITEKN